MGRKRATFPEGVAEEEQRYAQVLRDIRDLRGETQQISIWLSQEAWVGVWAMTALGEALVEPVDGGLAAVGRCPR